MDGDNAAVNILYEQAVSDIRKQHVKPGNHIDELKEYKSTNKKVKVSHPSKISISCKVA